MGHSLRSYCEDLADAFLTCPRVCRAASSLLGAALCIKRLSCQGRRISSFQGHQRVKPSQASDKNRRSPLKESKKDRCEKKKLLKFAKRPPSRFGKRMP